ncbi:hypothetical protein YK48G_09600 [Lentilactobacillus fungorum]|uniref:Uncharacterized protein n=1 Tax=Lentilactobacillus fungorum TaxID=2201250 RepID=A0ABQ3VXA4_9LACO|nr:hypothetical protein YK48G_09600 [Lentilactobacillus fungorum]
MLLGVPAVFQRKLAIADDEAMNLFWSTLDYLNLFGIRVMILTPERLTSELLDE